MMKKIVFFSILVVIFLVIGGCVNDQSNSVQTIKQPSPTQSLQQPSPAITINKVLPESTPLTTPATVKNLVLSDQEMFSEGGAYETNLVVTGYVTNNIRSMTAKNASITCDFFNQDKSVILATRSTTVSNIAPGQSLKWTIKLYPGNDYHLLNAKNCRMYVVEQ